MAAGIGPSVVVGHVRAVSRCTTMAGHDVVAAMGEGPGLVETALAHRPELCIVDVPEVGPTARVVVLSKYVELSYAEDLLADGRGGIGYRTPVRAKLGLLPDETGHRRVRAVRTWPWRG